MNRIFVRLTVRSDSITALLQTAPCWSIVWAVVWIRRWEKRGAGSTMKGKTKGPKGRYRRRTGEPHDNLAHTGHQRTAGDRHAPHGVSPAAGSPLPL